MLRENLSIKKCTTVLLECVGVVSFSSALCERQTLEFFFCDASKHSDRVITYEDVLL